MVDNTLKIGLVGMDYRSMSVFRSTIVKHLKGNAELVNVTTADIAIFDFDSTHAKEQFKAFKSLYPTVSTIGVASQLSSDSEIPIVRKPINFSQLFKTMQSLSKKPLNWDDSVFDSQSQASLAVVSSQSSKRQLADLIDHDTDGVNSRYNLANTGDNSETFDPKKFLLSEIKEVVKEAKALKKYRKIALWNDKYLIIDPFKNIVLTDMSPGVLRGICLTSIDSGDHQIDVVVTNEKKVEEEIAKSKPNTYTIDALLWLMSILSSRGRVPTTVDGMEFDQNCPVYLLHWPNLTRLEQIPHAQNIISLWIRQPRTLQDISNTLGVDRKYVNNIFIAANALGIAGQAKRPADTLFAPAKPAEHKQRGLLSRIMQKLQSSTVNSSKAAYAR